jgi:hypothetical protein
MKLTMEGWRDWLNRDNPTARADTDNIPYDEIELLLLGDIQLTKKQVVAASADGPARYTYKFRIKARMKYGTVLILEGMPQPTYDPGALFAGWRPQAERYPWKFNSPTADPRLHLDWKPRDISKGVQIVNIPHETDMPPTAVIQRLSTGAVLITYGTTTGGFNNTRDKFHIGILDEDSITELEKKYAYDSTRDRNEFKGSMNIADVGGDIGALSISDN